MLGAKVIVQGAMWDEAHKLAMKLAEEPGSALAHPFEHPDIWEGHSTIITEVAEQLKGRAKPSVVVCSVGGGGLLIGILQGLHKVGWGDVPVIAAETKGADSFAQSHAAGAMVTLPAITSIAKTLGAATVSKEAFRWIEKHRILPCVVSDAEAVSACLRFADDHRSLVEPACVRISFPALYLEFGGFNRILF
jgi:L-serine/L-threonine ammonia-lyase